MPYGFALRCAAYLALSAATSAISYPARRPSVQYSYLSGHFNGTLPIHGWQALGSLAELSVGFPLSGQLAAAFPDSLQELYLASNSFTAISPDWRPPPHLHNLSLLYNQLNQTLEQQQSWLAAAPELQVLDLDHNSLHGTVPIDLALPPSLTQLSLSSNKLSSEAGRGRLASYRGWRLQCCSHAQRTCKLCGQWRQLAMCTCHACSAAAGTLPPIRLPRSLQNLTLSEVRALCVSDLLWKLGAATHARTSNFVLLCSPSNPALSLSRTS